MDYDRRLSTITKVTKVFVPVLIAVAIIGIWFLKQNENKPPADTTQDFALEAVETDLARWKTYKLPVVIAFGSDTCPSCVEMMPVLKKLNGEFKGKAIIKYIDIGENPDAAKDFPVGLIPTLFFFGKDGNPFTPKDEQAMQLTLYSDSDTNAHVYTAHVGGMTEAQLKEVLREMGAE